MGRKGCVTRWPASDRRHCRRAHRDAGRDRAGRKDWSGALRAWRAETAREAGVPAYIVFGDATLRALAEARPVSLAALGGITGIGEKKRAAYGEAVLAVVAAEG